MAISPMNRAIDDLRKAVLAQDVVETTDGQLLERFVSRREGAALEALVQRHGPMVWGVCRRLLNHHDAEDAFHATFLVLVRQAGSIVPREMVGNWLYGVAHQAALNARTRIGKRRTREVQVMEMPEPTIIEQDCWRDLQLGLGYGRVDVKGQTLEEAEASVRQYLRTILKDPDVSITRHDPVPDERVQALEGRVRQLEEEIRKLRAIVDGLQKQKGK
jgi:RNA polymerase sigma factor (sigma-70 family)